MDANIDCDEFVTPIENGFNMPYSTDVFPNEAIMKGFIKELESLRCYENVDFENIPSLMGSRRKICGNNTSNSPSLKQTLLLDSHVSLASKLSRISPIKLP